MVDFLAQTKLPGVLIAKASLNKADFDNVLLRNRKLKERLKEIGYLVKINSDTYSRLTKQLDDEYKAADIHIKDAQFRAEILTNTLTIIFKKFAEISPHETVSLYHLMQILFIWDEFIDFEDYQNSGGDINKIRESVYYRAATLKMKEMNGKELNDLNTKNINKSLFENGLQKLQLKNTAQKFTSDKHLLILTTLENGGLSGAEIVYFLLIVESAIFMQIAEKLAESVDKVQLAVFDSVTTINEGIALVKKMFGFTAEKLEDMIDREAESFLLKLGNHLFS